MANLLHVDGDINLNADIFSVEWPRTLTIEGLGITSLWIFGSKYNCSGLQLVGRSVFHNINTTLIG